MRLPNASAALLLALPLLAACGSARSLPAWRRAVIVHAPDRADTALAARKALLDDGWEVDVTSSGPARRGRSSLAVYTSAKFPKMASHLEEVLAPSIGEVEVLPFLQPGPGGASAVLWVE